MSGARSGGGAGKLDHLFQNDYHVYMVVKDIRAEGGEADFLPADLHDAASARQRRLRAGRLTSW